MDNLEDTEELLNESIDNYSLLNKNQKKLLKALVKISINGEVAVSVKDLSHLINVSSATVLKALLALEKNDIINNIIRRGIIFTGCSINKQKINTIVLHHKTNKSFLNKK